jgi:hypothetical protein
MKNIKSIASIGILFACSIFYTVREQDKASACSVAGEMEVSAEVMELTTNRLLNLPPDVDNLRAILEKPTHWTNSHSIKLIPKVWSKLSRE